MGRELIITLTRIRLAIPGIITCPEHANQSEAMILWIITDCRIPWIITGPHQTHKQTDIPIYSPPRDIARVWRKLHLRIKIRYLMCYYSDLVKLKVWQI